MLVVKQDIDGKGKQLVTTQPFNKDEVICSITNYEVIAELFASSLEGFLEVRCGKRIQKVFILASDS
ncbi:hypothetical protein LC609_33365 [Nostoc sp. XA013]|nr:hypothetical protein [Nostoc sp. XA013]